MTSSSYMMVNIMFESTKTQGTDAPSSGSTHKSNSVPGLSTKRRPGRKRAYDDEERRERSRESQRNYKKRVVDRIKNLEATIKSQDERIRPLRQENHRFAEECCELKIRNSQLEKIISQHGMCYIAVSAIALNPRPNYPLFEGIDAQLDSPLFSDQLSGEHSNVADISAEPVTSKADADCDGFERHYRALGELIRLPNVP
ncbi:hypothetical protein ACJ73_02051 [Blastomyces percursus]|uniref:BZIP domain-containing protein n=1 Tax=Blastomyces percursus TaxID=1658174 RepID=A0A1J9QDF3_9EURO|nr:hypothetical protein ACJ73_02051 [Blastomyces percursus]